VVVVVVVLLLLMLISDRGPPFGAVPMTVLAEVEALEEARARTCFGGGNVAVRGDDDGGGQVEDAVSLLWTQ